MEIGGWDPGTAGLLGFSLWYGEVSSRKWWRFNRVNLWDPEDLGREIVNNGKLGSDGRFGFLWSG